GPEIKWHAGPTPVIYLQFAGYVGLSVRIWSNIGFIPIGLDFPSQNSAAIILATSCILKCFLRTERSYRLDHLSFLVPHGIGVERNRRLHCYHRQGLKDMIWHHAAHPPGFFA